MKYKYIIIIQIIFKYEEGIIMSIVKPYYRIFRESVGGLSNDRYVLDNQYADDRSMLCRSYKILENELKVVFEYIEPSNDNLNVYSHQIYQLLLRAATEFETNCKRILNVNGYIKSGNLNIDDYYKINKATKLNEYEVYIDVWRPNRKLLKPFKSWSTNSHLDWYHGYNSAKHDRYINFNDASLSNLINAMAGVFCILFAQFGPYSFSSYQLNSMYEENDEGFLYLGESIFSIKPITWTSPEKYDFNWVSLKTQVNPIEKFQF